MTLPANKLKYMEYLLISLAIAYVLIYCCLAVLRMPCGFELEWTEGLILEHIRQILSGHSLYLRPSLQFIPAVYTPGYFYLAALVAKIFGVGFMSIRALSFLASLGCFAMIFLFVKRQTRNNFAGILAMGLFAATYRISGAWFDIARGDSLFLFLVLLAIYFLKFGKSWKMSALSGFCLFLAFFTKQTAIFIFLPIMLYCLFWNRKAFLYLLVIGGGLIALSTLYLNALYKGWYNYYVFNLLSQHPLLYQQIINFWTIDILKSLPLALLMSMIYLFKACGKGKHSGGWFYLSLAMGMMGAAWVCRIHLGGYDNVLMPAYALLAILSGMAINAIGDKIYILKEYQGIKVKTAVYLLLIIQFVMLGYNPGAQIPTPEDARAGETIKKMVGSFTGEVYIFPSGYLTVLAGKKNYAHTQTMADTILYGKPGPVRDRLINEIKGAIYAKKFMAIITDYRDPLFQWFKPGIEKNYPRHGEIVYHARDFIPVTGMVTRPNYIYALEQKEFEK